MTRKAHLRVIALFMAALVLSLPVVFADQLSLIYDKNGNLVTGDGKYREFNEFNQLVRIRNGNTAGSAILEEYTYHPTEERILIKDTYNSTTQISETVFYINENFVRVENSTGTYDTVYVKQDGVLVAQKNSDGSKYFVHGDHLGSVSTITNEAGFAIENTTYEPFGAIILGGKQSRFDYEGKEFDSAVGDYDFHFRKYNPTLGLFTQPDTLIQNVYDPQTLNRYAFERNNPYRYTDEDGHEAIFIVFALLVGAGLGLLSYRIEHAQEESIDADEADQVAREQSVNEGTVETAQQTSIFLGASLKGAKVLGYTLSFLLDMQLVGNPSDSCEYPGNICGDEEPLDDVKLPDPISSQGLPPQMNKQDQRRDYSTPQSSSGSWSWDRAAYNDLKDIAENAEPGATARDVIDKWREQWGSD